MIVPVESFKNSKRGREVEGRGSGVRSEIEALAGDVGARDFIRVETKARGRGVILFMMGLFLRRKRETQPVHGSHIIYIY